MLFVKRTKQYTMEKKRKVTPDLSILRQKAEKILKNEPIEVCGKQSEIEMLKLIHELAVRQIELELQNDEIIKAKEQAVKVASKKYAELYDFAPLGFITLSSEGEIVAINICGSQMLGKQSVQLKNSRFAFFIADETKPIFDLFLSNVFKNNLKETCEITLSGNGKLPIYVYLSGILIENEEYCLVSMVDVTARKLAEELIQENNSRLELAMKVANMAWWEMDITTGKVNFEKRKAEMLGYNPDQFTHYQDFTTLLHPEDFERAMHAMQAHFDGKVDKYELEYRILAKSGEYLWFYDVGSIVKRDLHGNPLIITGVVLNITERKKTDEALKQLNEALEDRVVERTAELLKSNTALRQTEEKYRTVADFTYDWEYWINAQGGYNYVSPSCERITGYTVGEFINNPKLLDRIVFTADFAIWENHKKEGWMNMSGGINPDLNFRIVTKSGTLRWICCVYRRIYSDGKYLGIRASNRDITEKIKAENELLNVTIEVEERERNRFSRELHDGLGPLLSTIKLYFQWLAETNDAGKVKIITEKGNNCIEKAIQTTREVALGLSSLILNSMGYVETVLNFTQSINDTQKLNIDFTYNSNDRFSYFLETTLYRITTELINNTVKYAKATQVGIVFNYQKEKNLIFLTYNDNGIGFDLVNIEKTSKGLGLIHIQQRIKVIKGIMKIETGAGSGMEVLIQLPVINLVDGFKPETQKPIYVK